jgi:aspartyl protease family protein
MAVAGIGVAGLLWVLSRATSQPGAQVDWSSAGQLSACLLLAASGLVAARRFSVSGTAKAIAGWVLIFGVSIAGFALRDDVGRLAVKVRSALVPGEAVTDRPGSVVVSRAADGAFYVVGSVNGQPVRFVVDTGSGDIVLSPADARRVGLEPDAGAYRLPSETANGVGYSAAATLDSLAIGPIRLKQVPVAVNQTPMSASLLGMSFLRRLDSFEVRGDQLFLRGRS